MGKRDWRNEVPEVQRLANYEQRDIALWAIVERLEVLVAIGDALEGVGDLWANTLAFGGQPVGEATPIEAFKVAKPWMCDGDPDCILMKGHGGEHVHKGSEPNYVHEPVRYCWCIAPDFNTGGVCGKCGFLKASKVSDA